MRPPTWSGTSTCAPRSSSIDAQLRWSGWPCETHTNRAARMAASCSSAEPRGSSVQLPKYASPTNHGSVTSNGPRSCTISVALPIVSKAELHGALRLPGTLEL